MHFWDETMPDEKIIEKPYRKFNVVWFTLILIAWMTMQTFLTARNGSSS